MMYKWLDAKVHDVETFNKIFNLSKLQGLNSKEEVKIGEMLIGGLREVTVNNCTQIIELKSFLGNKYSYKEFEGDDSSYKKATLDPTLNENQLKALIFIQDSVHIVSNKAIEEELSLSKRAVSRILKVLRDKDLIEQDTVGDKGNTKVIRIK
jgi:DNA-binding transcriptional ArsR family regulator